MVREYTLGELAENSGLTERTVRLYRTKGLLSPGESRGRQRVYHQQHLTELRLITAMTDRGFPLSVVATVLGSDVSKTALVYLLESMTPARRLEPGAGVAPAQSEPATFDREAMDEILAAHPEIVEIMLEKGLVRRTPDGGIGGDPFGMAIVGDLAGQGVAYPVIAEFAMVVSQAAEQVAEHIEGQLHPSLSDDHLRHRLLDAATVIFRETLRQTQQR
ncbi:MAG: MerR family transcriptional regulator [Micrococcales bacterium]|nr:MerR family transcriptional regulator [Micrococcales bacterium]